MKITITTIIAAFIYFVLADTYYYAIGLYDGIYASWLQCVIGGQIFALQYSYYKFVMFAIFVDLIIQAKKGAIKLNENKIIRHR